MADSITPSSKPTIDPPSPSRRPFRGSCHCGVTRYIAFLTFPPLLTPESRGSSIRIYKCNCSTCQKMSLFHVRLVDAPNDFFLLSPLDPEAGGLGDYTCFDKDIHFFFCKTCGVRCFAFTGESQVGDVNPAAFGGVLSDEESAGAATVKAWGPKAKGWVEGRSSYLTVNAATLETGQEGVDLREWAEKGWIWYLDCRNNKGTDRLKDPYEGGCY